MAESRTLFHAGEPPSRAEKFFVAVALLLSTGAFMNLGIKPGDVPSHVPSAVSLSITGLIYLITLILLNRHCKGFIRILLREWPLVALAGLAMASALWSQVPGASLRHGVALLLTFLFGLYLSLRYNLREQLRLLAWVCGICVIFSFIFGLLGLGTSVDAADGVPGWYGVFGQKNSLGQTMALSALIFLFWRRSEPKHRRLASAGFLASVLLIALSQSMTAILVVVLLLMLTPYVLWASRKTTQWIVAGFASLAVAGAGLLVFVATHLPEVTGSLGKSVTLTGRIQIWILSIFMALRRPWLGYGYTAFWLPDERYVQRIWQLLGWAVPHAHNGFIELWLELGLCGLGIFVAGLAIYVWRSLRFLVRQRVPEAAWPLVFLAFIFLSNITQVNLLYSNSIFVVLYAAAAVSTSPQRVAVRIPTTIAVPMRESPSIA